MKFFNSFFIFFSLAAMAQEIVISVKTDYTVIPLNQPFTFTLTIQYEGKKPKNLETPNLSELKNFDVLSKWSGSQSSISIINGRMEKTQSLEYNYQLQAQKKGIFRIKSLDVKIRGKIYKTKEVDITVTEKQKQLAPSRPRSSFPKSFFNTNPFFNTPNIFSNKPTLKTDVKVKVNLSKSMVYEGEALKANWILLVSSGNIQYEVNKSPKLKGFWKEAVTLNSQGQFLGTSIVDNVLYRKTLFDSMILFPLRSGQLVIDSYSLRIRSMFGFGHRSKIKRTPSNSITVKPLPSQGKRFFSGAVGNFKVTSFLKEKEVKVNEPIAYNIKFEGNGHPQFIKLPKIPFPSIVKTYAPVEKSEFHTNGKSFKNYEIILIPKIEGQLTLPSFQISTFDPEMGKYIYHQMPSFQIKVLKGDASSEEGIHFFGDGQQIAKDSNQLKPLQQTIWPDFLKHKFLMRFWLFFYALIAFIFLLLSFWPFKQKQKTVKEKLRKGLREVGILIDNKKWQPSSVKLISLVYLALYQFDTKNTSVDWPELVKELPPSSHEKHGSSLISLMRNLEKLSFAPKKLSDEEALAKIKILYRQAEDLLMQLFD